MAFGDQVGTAKQEYKASTDAHRLTLDAIPIQNNIIVVCHFTGNANSVAMAGMTEAVAVTDGPNADQGAIYYRVVASTADSQTWGANSSGADESAMTLSQYEGPFSTSLSGTPDTDGPNSPGATQTAGTMNVPDADALVVGMVTARSAGGLNLIDSWSDSFTAIAETDQTQTKAIGSARKVLGSTGSVTATATWNATPGSNTMGAIAAFKQSTGASTSPIPIAAQAYIQVDFV